MNSINKYVGFFSSLVILFFICISLNVSAQIVHNDKTDATIVHNDKTGIVLERVEMNQNQSIMKIQDSETGHIFQSKPTLIKSNVGDAVIFREICHCTCVVMRNCK